MKVAIVNDSLVAVEALQAMVLLDPSLEVCWIASNGQEAVERCLENAPDLILMDIIMPVMDGVEATRRIMKTAPCLILIVTASVSRNAAKIFEAMGSGALDVVTVSSLDNREKNANRLLKKINTIGKLSGINSSLSSLRNNNSENDFKVDNQAKLVVIGCSTGGPLAALKILSTFPADFPAAFVLVQHMDERFTRGLAEWLDQQIALEARILKENDLLMPGVVLVPSAKAHVVLKENGRIGYQEITTAGGFYVPSVDIFFKSVALRWAGESVGVLLTGMGWDGAEGLLAMRKKGMYTIAQNKESCVVFGMPKVAIEIDAAKAVLPLDKIGAKINSVIK